MIKIFKKTGLFLTPPLILFIYGIVLNQYRIVFDSLYTILCIAVSRIINKKTRFLNNGTYHWVVIFVLLAVFAGRGLNFYATIPYWDKILHFLSGFIAVSEANHIYNTLAGDGKNKKLLTLFVAAFAIATAGLWEIYEFLGDNLLKTNAQNGSLNDTMLDMAVGTVGSIISVIIPSIKKLFNDVNAEIP